MTKKPDDVFAALHAAQAKHLLDRIRSGKATAAELEVARKFLHDNGIQDSPSRAGGGVNQLKDEHDRLSQLPYVDPDRAVM